MKDLDPLKYFLGIEVAQSTSCIAISQRKYVLGILIEIGMLNCRPCDTAMDSNIKLLLGLGESLEDLEKYHRLVGGLNYLIVTRSNITFAISVVSQFLNAPCDSHWHVVMCILQYIKNASGCRLLYEEKVIPKLSVILMLIGQDHHQAGDLPLVFVFLLEVT